jgi:hypothetical protein
MSQTVYQQMGFENRKAYLDDLAANYGKIVYELATMLGPSEDFDGLVTELEDYADMFDEDGDE